MGMVYALAATVIPLVVIAVGILAENLSLRKRIASMRPLTYTSHQPADLARQQKLAAKRKVILRSLADEYKRR